MIVCILYWAFHIIFVVITIDVHTSSLKPHKLFRCKHRGKRKGWQAEHWWLKPEVSSVRLPVPTSLFISYFCFKFLYFQHEARCSVHKLSNICQLLSHIRLSVAQYYNWSDYYDSHLTCMLVLSFPSSLTQHMFYATCMADELIRVMG